MPFEFHVAAMYAGWLIVVSVVAVLLHDVLRTWIRNR